MKKKLILIQHLGNEGVRIEAFGYKGSACDKATEKISKALGTRTSYERKPEYHQQQEATTDERATQSH